MFFNAVQIQAAWAAWRALIKAQISGADYSVHDHIVNKGQSSKCAIWRLSENASPDSTNVMMRKATAEPKIKENNKIGHREEFQGMDGKSALHSVWLLFSSTKGK